MPTKYYCINLGQYITPEEALHFSAWFKTYFDGENITISVLTMAGYKYLFDRFKAKYLINTDTPAVIRVLMPKKYSGAIKKIIKEITPFGVQVIFYNKKWIYEREIKNNRYYLQTFDVVHTPGFKQIKPVKIRPETGLCLWGQKSRLVNNPELSKKLMEVKEQAELKEKIGEVKQFFKTALEENLKPYVDESAPIQIKPPKTPEWIELTLEVTKTGDSIKTELNLDDSI